MRLEPGSSGTRVSMPELEQILRGYDLGGLRKVRAFDKGCRLGRYLA